MLTEESKQLRRIADALEAIAYHLQMQYPAPQKPKENEG